MMHKNESNNDSNGETNDSDEMSSGSERAMIRWHGRKSSQHFQNEKEHFDRSEFASEQRR